VLHKPKTSGGAGAVGLIDIGTTKVVCLIAAEAGADASHARIIGVGHQRSRGVKAGVVTDLDAAEQAVRTTIAEAERMAGVTIEDVHVAVSCGRLTSQSFAAKATIERGVVGDADIARLMAGGRAYAEREGRTLVHLNRLNFRLDGASGISDPRRMAGRRLVADLHAVSADDAPVRNLMLLVERCFLSVTGLVAAPYASALAATSAEERRLGVTCIDIGGGTTSIAVFANGQFVFADAVPVGGDHVTFDIARALQCPLAEAERIKVLYGTLVIAPSDEHEVFAYPLAGEEEGSSHSMTKAQLALVVRPRVAALVEHICDRMERAGVRAQPGNRVVFTGGGSGFVGMREFAMGVLGRPVRVGRPQAVVGLPQSFSSPAFATAVGLHAAAITGSQGIASRRGRDHAPGYFGRVGQWLREGF
jgi:cell division protein FtsA